MKQCINVARVGAVLAAVAVCGMMFSAHAATIGDADVGKIESSKCIVCHGSAGQGSPGTPSIAGQPQAELVAKLKAYRDGERSHILMSRAAQRLSDQSIADLAAYYSSLKR